MMARVCPRCRHVLEEGIGVGRCPNCGTAVDGKAEAEIAGAGAGRDGQAGDGWAVASLVCGLGGCVPVVPQVLAVVFGWISLRRGRKASGRGRYRGLAVAGIVCGLVFGAVWVVGLGAGVLTVQQTGVTMGPSVWPAFGGAVPAATLDEGELKMKRISEGLDLFRRDYRRWPANLDELVPAYVPGHVLQLPEGTDKRKGDHFVTYVRPNEGEADPVILYSIPFTEDRDGGVLKPSQRWALRKSGEVVLMDADAAELESASRADGEH